MPPHPLMRMRSRTSIRCGLVKRPVLYPEWRSMLSTKAAVDPLPFVPAMWMTFRLSRRSSRSRRWGGGQEGPFSVRPTTQSATARAPIDDSPPRNNTSRSHLEVRGHHAKRMLPMLATGSSTAANQGRQSLLGGLHIPWRHHARPKTRQIFFSKTLMSNVQLAWFIIFNTSRSTEPCANVPIPGD